MLGLPRGIVRLAPYTAEWKVLFEKEAALLASVLGEFAMAIEHVGSTAIEGMDAKPIIDLMIAVPSLAEASNWTSRIEALGYEFRPDPDIPERIFFARGEHTCRTHHLSLTEPSSTYYKSTLQFRDYLKSNAAARASYLDLKRKLALEYQNDRGSYTLGKTDFVNTVLREAERQRC